jgi:hypothetical protein
MREVRECLVAVETSFMTRTERGIDAGFCTIDGGLNAGGDWVIIKLERELAQVCSGRREDIEQGLSRD